MGGNEPVGGDWGRQKGGGWTRRLRGWKAAPSAPPAACVTRGGAGELRGTAAHTLTPHPYPPQTALTPIQYPHSCSPLPRPAPTAGRRPVHRPALPRGDDALGAAGAQGGAGRRARPKLSALAGGRKWWFAAACVRPVAGVVHARAHVLCERMCVRMRVCACKCACVPAFACQHRRRLICASPSPGPGPARPARPTHTWNAPLPVHSGRP